MTGAETGNEMAFEEKGDPLESAFKSNVIGTLEEKGDPLESTNSSNVIGSLEEKGDTLESSVTCDIIGTFEKGDALASPSNSNVIKTLDATVMSPGETESSTTPERKQIVGDDYIETHDTAVVHETIIEAKAMIEEIRPNVMQEKEYDLSLSKPCFYALFPLSLGAMPYKTVLHMGTDEVTKTDISIYGQSECRRPYDELGSVAKSNCLCCVVLSSSFGDVSPGSGCEAEIIDDIVVELKARQRSRVDAAQAQIVEQTMERLDRLEANIDRIMDAMYIER